MSETVTNNTTDHRFELVVDGHTAFIDYRTETAKDDARPVYVFEHTEVPPVLGGRGVGSRLAEGALEAVREANGRVRSECSFITAILKKHHERYADIAAGT